MFRPPPAGAHIERLADLGEIPVPQDGSRRGIFILEIDLVDGKLHIPESQIRPGIEAGNPSETAFRPSDDGGNGLLHHVTISGRSPVSAVDKDLFGIDFQLEMFVLLRAAIKYGWIGIAIIALEAPGKVHFRISFGGNVIDVDQFRAEGEGHVEVPAVVGEERRSGGNCTHRAYDFGLDGRLVDEGVFPHPGIEGLRARRNPVGGGYGQVGHRGGGIFPAVLDDVGGHLFASQIIGPRSGEGSGIGPLSLSQPLDPTGIPAHIGVVRSSRREGGRPFVFLQIFLEGSGVTTVCRVVLILEFGIRDAVVILLPSEKKVHIVEIAVVPVDAGEIESVEKLQRIYLLIIILVDPEGFRGGGLNELQVPVQIRLGGVQAGYKFLGARAGNTRFLEQGKQIVKSRRNIEMRDTGVRSRIRRLLVKKRGQILKVIVVTAIPVYPDI